MAKTKMNKRVDAKKASGMDISFIGQPHEWDPRRLYSQTGVDWQHRVDFDRLRKDRLARLRSLRSEEHTSELQSPYDLVCRLLLEKKKSTGIPGRRLASRATAAAAAIVP